MYGRMRADKDGNIRAFDIFRFDGSEYRRIDDLK
jgi:hypothetical protein